MNHDFDPIFVTKTFLPPLREYTALLERVWASKWLTNRGALVLELEASLTKYLGINHILAVSNGTIALQLAIRVLGLKNEVITTPFSYVATASSLIWEYCVPKFVDIESDTLTIDPARIQKAITSETTGILATHVFGNPCDVEAIEVISKKSSLSVIYDAAHSFGVKYNGESILNSGDVSTLSFHATKLFHTGEGGAVVSNRPELNDKISYLHNFGHKGQEEFHCLGINGKLSELAGAMGLAVLPYLPEIIQSRKKIVEVYDSMLEGTHFQTLKIRQGAEWNYSYYPVLFPSEKSLLKTLERLSEINVFPRRYFFPSLNNLPYLESIQECPIAESVSKRIVCLPLYDSLSSREVETICNVLLRSEK